MTMSTWRTILSFEEPGGVFPGASYYAIVRLIVDDPESRTWFLENSDVTVPKGELGYVCKVEENYSGDSFPLTLERWEYLKSSDSSSYTLEVHWEHYRFDWEDSKTGCKVYARDVEIVQWL